MSDPPDPGGCASVASYVTISTNESGMDTDVSTSSRRFKRSRLHICKHCNKRKRKHHGPEPKPSDCICITVDSEETEVRRKVPIVVTQQQEIQQSTSNQVHPVPVGRTLYDKTDVSPYIIHVQKLQTAPNDGTSMHPITFGKFLKRNLFQNVINGSLKKIGRNKISISFSNHNDANNFINHKSLESNSLRAFIPSFNITRLGLVRGVPSEWSLDEIKENITVPVGCGEVLKVRRLNYKSFVDGSPVWKPSQTIVVTFDGQILPKRVFCCFNALNVDLYIYPTIQCYNCCRFGHTKIQCRSKPRCYKCGLDHSADSCNILEDGASCCLCSGFHYAINKSCSEYVRQTRIKSYMAQNCVSYAEASKLHPPATKSFADIVSSIPNRDTSNSGPSVSYPNSNSYPTSTSYKKTVFLKPQSRAPLSKGYDKEAHKALVKEFSIPNLGNGCALNNSPVINPNLNIPNDFLTALFNLLSQFNLLLPSNVANIQDNNIQSTNNGPRQNNTMEL
jgi:hypothetical protein